MYVYCSCVAPLLMKYQQTQLATQEPQNKGENLNQTEEDPKCIQIDATGAFLTASIFLFVCGDNCKGDQNVIFNVNK